MMRGVIGVYFGVVAHPVEAGRHPRRTDVRGPLGRAGLGYEARG